MNKIYETLKPEDNNLVSEYKDNLSQRDLLFALDEAELEERESLGLDSNITFGTELEFDGFKSLSEQLDFYEMFKKYRSLKTWNLQDEATLVSQKTNGKIYGAEISSPILRDKKHCWLQLRECCNLIKGNNLYASNRCGGHIHVGANILNNNKNNWKRFLLLYAAYEDIIYRFGMGDKQEFRDSLRIYAPPVAGNFYILYKCLEEYKGDDLMNYIGNNSYAVGKNQGINLGNIRNKSRNKTIEFRSPNGTLEPIIWQNNISLVTNLLKKSTQDLDEEKVIAQIKSLELYTGVSDKLNRYARPNVDKALEFADLIFDNNEDKIRFLKQYANGFLGEKEKVKVMVK